MLTELGCLQLPPHPSTEDTGTCHHTWLSGLLWLAIRALVLTLVRPVLSWQSHPLPPPHRITVSQDSVGREDLRVISLYTVSTT